MSKKATAVENQEDATLDEPTGPSDIPFTPDASVDDMSMEELKAMLLKQRQELEALKTAKTRKAVARPSLSPEEQAALDEKVAAAREKVATAESALREAKAELSALVPRSVGSVQRGPSGVGAFIKNLINEGKTNEEILSAVVEEFPNNFTNTNCINWYRNAIKKWGPEGKRPSSKSSGPGEVKSLKGTGFDAAEDELPADVTQAIGEAPEGMPE